MTLSGESVTRYVTSLRKSCDGCPYQWAAYEPSTEKEFYARSRHGRFYAHFSDPGGVEMVVKLDREVETTWEMLQLANIELVMTP
jgi:hypothetical protein